jgi:hypothetical protein
MITNNDRELFDKIQKGLTDGVRKAVQEHKKAGHSISVWKNGKVERIPPDKIEVIEST